MSRRKPRVSHSAVRFHISPRGNATVAGIEYHLMQDIFTMAALHAYDSLKQAQENKDKRSPEDQQEAIAWVRQVISTLDMLKHAAFAGMRERDVKDGYPSLQQDRPLAEIPKAERLEQITKVRKERLLIEGLVGRAMESLAKRREEKKAEKAAPKRKLKKSDVANFYNTEFITKKKADMLIEFGEDADVSEVVPVTAENLCIRHIWECSTSPTKWCVYDDACGSEYCIFCGQPEERK